MKIPGYCVIPTLADELRRAAEIQDARIKLLFLARWIGAVDRDGGEKGAAALQRRLERQWIMTGTGAITDVMAALRREIMSGDWPEK